MMFPRNSFDNRIHMNQGNAAEAAHSEPGFAAISVCFKTLSGMDSETEVIEMGPSSSLERSVKMPSQVEFPNLSCISEMGEMESLRLQMAMDRHSKSDSANSNILKKYQDTADAIVANMR
jgi:hypothetical protein